MNRIRLSLCFLLMLTAMLCGCTERKDVGMVNGTVTVEAIIQSPLEISYTLEAIPVKNASNARLIKSGSGSLNIQDAIASWNTTGYADGEYTLVLNVTDSRGRRSTDTAYLTVENNPKTQTKGECPKWSCDGLALGHNNVNISVTQDQYKDYMNCTILCTCPENTTGTRIYSRGYIDYSDALNFKGKAYYPEWENVSEPPQMVLEDDRESYTYDGNWSDDYAPVFDTNIVESNFLTDGSLSGQDGYTGFKVTDYVCDPYCVSEPDFGGYSYIAKVSIGQDVMTSGSSIYSDNTKTIFTTLQAGENYTLKVYVKNDDSNKCYQDVAAWIDYNQDYLFEPADEHENANSSEEGSNPERITLGGTVMTKETHVFSKEFTVPSNATAGRTRLRVSLKPCDLTACTGDQCISPIAPENHTSCGDIPFGGVVEDYEINILPQTGCELSGDDPPCGQVTINEIISAIQKYKTGQMSLQEIIELINTWATSA